MIPQRPTTESERDVSTSLNMTNENGADGVGYALPVPSPQSPVPSPQSPVPSPQSPVPSPQSPVPSRQSPVASRQSPVISRQSSVDARQVGEWNVLVLGDWGINASRKCRVYKRRWQTM